MGGSVGKALFENFLRKAVQLRASDLHLKTGIPPVVRIARKLRLLSKNIEPLGQEQIHDICQEILSPDARKTFEAGTEVDIAYSFPKVGRFRLNIFRHRGQVGIVARFIPFEIKDLEQLGLPKIVKKIALQRRGLILITGTAGSGKSTTMAAMINEWNRVQGGHVITVEDPIEYLIRDRKAIITQREIGLDTESFKTGLKYALRQDPDVIMIGELRDQETILAALNAAETGHLVLGTLHTRDAKDTVSRVIGAFDPGTQTSTRVQLASALSAVISQRLVPLASAKRTAESHTAVAVEVMVNTSRIRGLILDPNRRDEMIKAIEEGYESHGMQSFDQSLMHLYNKGRISQEIALQYASNPGEFELKLRGIRSGIG